MLTRGRYCDYGYDNGSNSNRTGNGSVNSGDEFEAFTFAAQATLPQLHGNLQNSFPFGGLAVNAALVNVPILSAQFNVANGGDANSIPVNYNNQVQSNEA